MNEGVASEKAFNLLHEDWIIVKRNDGSTEEVSLLDAFRRAHEFRGLAGELPTQDVAILRLMLAVLYAVFTRMDEQGNPSLLKREDDAFNRWKALWDCDTIPYDIIEEYLLHYEDRFWLFHPTTPFYQVAGLYTGTGKINPVSQIISDIPSRVERRFFSNRSGVPAEEMQFSEAARWLVNMQSWDYAGKKASVVGGTPNGGGTGWLGKLGVVYFRNESLVQTLLCNLVLLDSSGGLLDFGTPAWESEVAIACKLDKDPRSYVELLTWQSRRVLLFCEDQKVIGVLSSYGDVFDKANTFIEQMSGWRESKAVKAFIPVLHESGKSAWRDLGSLLPHRESANRISGSVSWIARLRLEGILDIPLVNFDVVGTEYGSMQSSISEIAADGITLNAEILTLLGQQWISDIVAVIGKADRLVWQLGILERDLLTAAGNDDEESKKGSSATVREEMFFSLDIPFREWLVSINPAQDNQVDVMNNWLDFTEEQLRKRANFLVQETGDRAFVGRTIKDSKTDAIRIMSAPKAHDKFLREIRKIREE